MDKWGNKMPQNTPKRKIKDSVFTDLFQNKKYLLQLYKALHPEDNEVTENDLADITIKHVLMDGDYNDLGFSVGNRLMVLVSIDAEVKVLYQENESDIIGQYIIFSKVYNEQRKLHGATKKTILETIRICKDRNVLKDYLENKEQEVVDMMMTLFDDEQILKAYANDIKNDTERNTAIQMIKDGDMPLEKIARYVPSLSMEELKKLEAEVLQLV